MGNKQAGVAVGGTASGGLAAGGIALMVLGGPVGIVAGGVMLGGGISGGVNTVQQGISEKDDFNYGSFALNTGIGAASGLITGGAGAIGANIATNVAKSALQEAAIITTSSVIGGAVSGGASTIATNAAEDRDLTDNLASSILIGGIAGGVGSGIGQATSKLQTQVAQGITKSATNTVKVVVGTAGGAVAGGLSGGSVQLLNNLAKYGEISDGDLTNFLTQQGASKAEAGQIIQQLLHRGYLLNGKITKIYQGRIHLDPQFRNYEGMIQDLFNQAKDVLKDIGMSVVTGLVVGGVSGAASSANQIIKEQKTLNQTSKSQQQSPQQQQQKVTETQNSQQKVQLAQGQVEAETIQTTKTSQSAKPTQPIESAQSTKQAQPTQPTQPGKSTVEETIKMPTQKAGKVEIVLQKDGRLEVKKELASTKQVNKYKLMEKIGTGVPVTKTEGNVIYMEKGIPLDQAIPTLEIHQINKIESDLNNIQKINVQNNVQHTDVKPQNVVILGEGDNISVKLIDNDYVTKFGKDRQVYSKEGETTKIQKQGQKVNKNTDKSGMKWIKNDLRKQKQTLIAKQWYFRIIHPTVPLNTQEAED